MKKFFRTLVEKLFYNFMVEVLEDEFEVHIQIKIDGQHIVTTKMKHLPQPGMFIDLLLPMNQVKRFKIEKIVLSHFGNVVIADGQFE